MLIADSLIGSGTALEGSAVEGSSIGPLTWGTSFTGMRREAGGATCVSGTNQQGDLEILYDGSGVDKAELFDIEAEFSLTGSTFFVNASLDVTASGFSGMFGSAMAGGKIAIGYNYAEYRVYTGSFAASTVYTDTASYVGYVKRRLVVDYSALTYECYANDVLIDSGSFSSSLVEEPSFRYGMNIHITADRRESASTAFQRNMQVSVESLAPPGAFWTDFVFAYEAP